MKISDLKLARNSGPVVWLDSQSPDHPSSRQSFFAANPDVEIRFSYGSATIRHPDGEQTLKGDPFRILSDIRKEFPGWYFGYFSYDLKNYTEEIRSVNPDPVALPEMWFIRAEKAEILMEEPGLVHDYSVKNLKSTTTSEKYQHLVQKVLHDIAEGEYYEVNISHQLRAEFTGDPLGLYLKMRRSGPVPFGAYITVDDAHICCASPERFLSKTGSRVVSEPIKGTARRGNDATEDEQLRRELGNSAKNKAENLMIVDLVRNDLNRVCVPGSVQVQDLFGIQSFRTVHQMVSAVTAEVRPEVGAEEVIRACFPMGSMTGAPKIRAMEAIEEMEDVRRGVYSGAIGYITPEDDFSFNVVIRTAIIRKGVLYYSAGGAITSDSDPASEWEETWVKAEALRSVI